MILLTVTALGLSSEALVILSNLVLALATALLFWATARADRHMMGEMHKDDVSLMKKIIRLLSKRSNDSN